MAQKACCPTCGGELSDKDAAEFERGFNDGLGEKATIPTSMLYVKGYQKGKEVRSIVSPSK